MFGLFGKKKKKKPQLLLEEVSPDGITRGVVEADGRSLFFYLCGAPGSEFGMWSVWVRNLVTAPSSLDVDAMEDGRAPANPAEYCRDDSAGSLPLREQLEVVWLPEGNGAALYENDTILAIIPPWSGEEGFHGYALEAAGTGPLAWELAPDNELIERFETAEASWDACRTDDQWASMRTQLISAYESALGEHRDYYAIDGARWPRKGLLTIPSDDRIVLATVGVSVRPQPNVERYTDDYKALSRVEFGVVLPMTRSDDDIERMASYLSGQSNYPWSNFTWLGPGHTIPCDAWKTVKYTSALLWHAHPAAAEVTHAPVFGDPVRILWFIPITDEERARAQQEGPEALFNSLPPDRWMWS